MDFHLFWEAKSQYTITYFVLLIPYCAKGLMDMTNEMIDSFRNIRIVRSIPKKIGMIIKMDTVRFIVFITALASIIKIIAYRNHYVSYLWNINNSCKYCCYYLFSNIHNRDIISMK